MTDNEKIIAALETIRSRLEDLFIMQASVSGIGQREIRLMLGGDRRRISKVAKHAKRKEGSGTDNES